MIIKYINYIAPSNATGLIAEIYNQMKRDFGRIAEPVALHSIIPELLASNWCVLRETNVTEDKVKRNVKDAIATTVSKINKCPWCVDAHTIMLIGLKYAKVAKAIETGNLDIIDNFKVKSIIEWALSNRSPNSMIIKNPPFTEDEAPEIIGTAVYYHYINRMVSVLLNESPLPPNISIFKGFMKKIAGWNFSSSLRKTKMAGESLKFIRGFDSNNEFSWAKTNERVAKSFTAFKNVVEKIAEEYVPKEVITVLEDALEEWQGEDSSLSRNWTEKHVAGIDKYLKPVVRLSLLTAISPYQIDEKIISSYREFNANNEALLGTLSWASFLAATRIGKWLGDPFSNSK